MRQLAVENNVGLLLRVLSVLAFIVFLLSFLFAGSLYWEFNFGDCKDGCSKGMVYIYFLPALVLAVTALLAAVGMHFLGVRLRAK
jgi:hypothetical protein